MKILSPQLRKILLNATIVASLIAVFSCASTRRSRPADPGLEESSKEKQPEWRTRLDIVEQRLATLENGMSHLNEKMDASRVSLDFLLGQKKAPESALNAVQPHPSQGAGREVTTPFAQSDPQIGYDEDAAVKSYRKAMILHQSGQHSEAILSFTSFLEKYPDHPFAGSAQFYTAEAYHLQKDERMAVKEYQKVLDHYPESTHITETLAGLSSSQEKIKDLRGSKKTRDLLATLFPHSPSANEPLSMREFPSQEKSAEDPTPTAPIRENPSTLDSAPTPGVPAGERSEFE